jgi:cellulose synthase/poly-beta-1,6-N-acetylglucosamine synthase-like glycosyltransferase
MRISILIPAHNEEKSIRRCLKSCLRQTRRPDEIVVVNDGSTDRTAKILSDFGERIKVVSIPNATGNKSFAQEIGLSHITGDVFICTDADTILDRRFVEIIEKDFADPKTAAVSGYVKSLKHNWLTACRALDYFIGQNLYKKAQSRLNFLFVVPGSAGAFRTKIFKKYIGFDHDTLTEDLDFTYKLHWHNLNLVYNRKAIVYTQDPSDLKSYINQMRRWYAGGWQNLIKHINIIRRPIQALELSMMYIEGLVFSVLLVVLPLISIYTAAAFLFLYLLILPIFAVGAGLKDKRTDVLFFFPLYPIIAFINAWVFVEQFLKEIIFKKKNLVWIQPKRINL